jgi:hypothetical protein
MNRHHTLLSIAVAALLLSTPAGANLIAFDAGDGRSASADFVANGSMLNLTLTNTSTISSGDATAILTSVAFDLGSVSILTGTSTISTGSTGQNFTAGTLPAGTNVGSEWGFGNNGQCCAGFGVDQFVSALTSGSTPFDSGAGDLDGQGHPTLNGPSSGLAGAGYNGSLAHIESSLDVVLNLSGSLSQAELDALLAASGVVFEWGSDDFPPNIPEPSAALVFSVGLLVVGQQLGTRKRKAL